MKKEIDLEGYSLTSLLEAVRVSVMVLFLVAGANVFSYFLALSTIPMKVSTWIVGLAVSKYVILVIIVVIYLILGCFLDAISMMILTLPVIFPVVLNLGFDPIWFGVVCVLMMGAGLITPPMGLCVFTVASIAKDAPLEEVFKGALPFLTAILFVTFLDHSVPSDCSLPPLHDGKVSVLFKTCRVRSPNAPSKGVIGDHALQNCNEMKHIWMPLRAISI